MPKTETHYVRIAVDIAPLGENGLLKLTSPDMPRFTMVGKSIAELEREAPLVFAALVNHAQASSRDRSPSG